VFVWAFDLLELDSQTMRREPIEARKATLASVLRSCRAGLQFNQHLEHPGDIVFRMQDGSRRPHLEAAGVALHQRPLARLAQVQESRGSGGDARVRGGLGTDEAAVTRAFERMRPKR
jgi:hypothetical protein